MPDWSKRPGLHDKSPIPLFNERCKEKKNGLPIINQNYPDYGFPIRDFHYEKAKPAGTFRILGIGDSFAWGWGVPDHLDTYFKRVECWFSKEDRGRKIEVINAAEPASTSWSQEEFLFSRGFQFSPDLILMQYNLNDAAEFGAVVPFDAWAELRQERKKNFLLRISKFYKHVDWLLTRAKVHRSTVRMYHEAYFGPEQKYWTICRQSILHIAAECRTRGITFVVQIFPLLYSLEEKTYEFAREVEAVENFLEKNGILCHDMLPDFRGTTSSVLWNLPSDSHPNEKGHRMAAESTYRFLTSRGLIPPLVEQRGAANQ